MRVVDPPCRPDMTATPRAGLPPFLPTLGLALAAALLSLVCREPIEADPARAVSGAALPAMAAAPSLSVFNPGNALVAELEPVPASEAFARLTPLVAAGDAAPARPPRATVAARTDRRRPPAPRMVATQTVPPKATPPAAFPAAPNEREEGFLPAGALPFAATADAVWDAARSVGSGATTLGSSVVTLVSELR